MKTPHYVKRILAGALLSGSVAVEGFGLAAGTAQANTRRKPLGNRKESTMIVPRQRRIVAATLLWGAAAFAGAGLGGGLAQAQPSPMVCQDPGSPPSPTNSCTYQWCPGSPVMKHMPDWDRSVCHPWYFDPNSPVTNSTIIEGFPPPRPPSPPCIAFVNCLPGL